MIHNNNSKDLDLFYTDLSIFITLKNSYNIFPKNYNFLEK